MKVKHKIPAVVLGMSVNGLGVVRSLARAGVPVIALDNETGKPNMSTRYASCRVCPHPQSEPQKLKEFLLQLSKEHGGRVVLFPTSDAFNSFIHLHRAQLPAELLYAMPSQPLMAQLLDKKGQYELALSCRVPVPQTVIPRHLDEIPGIARRLEYPVIIKGLNTVTWREKFGDKKAIIVNAADELLRHYEKLMLEDKLETIIQEIIVGDDTRHFKMCSYLNAKGDPLLTFTLQKIRQYPCDFGIGSCVVSKWEPEVAASGLKFLKDMKYQGVGSIEFKRDARDEKLKLIEVNPRLWAQNSLATVCGQNFALTEYLDLLGEKVDSRITFKEGVRWIAFKEDRASFYGYRRQGKLFWGAWLRSIFFHQRTWAIWAWDDPCPFLFETSFGFSFLLKALRKVRHVLTRAPAPASKPNASAGGDVTCDVITDFHEFLKLRAEWTDVLAKSGITNPFLQHDWLSSWWEGYGEGKKLFIVRFRMGTQAIGFAPLMTYTTSLTGIPTTAIGFLSNHWTRMDFIFSGNPQAGLEKLCDLLKTTKAVVILAQVDTQGRNCARLREILATKGIAFTETPKPHAAIGLQGSWEDYFNKQSRNFRMDSRRKLRRLEKEGPVELIRTSADDPQALEKLSTVARSSWQNEKNVNIVATPSGRTFYEKLQEKWRDSRKMDFSVLYFKGAPVSYMVGVRENGRYFAFDTAYDKSFEGYSPGLVLHNVLIENLFKEGIQCLDLGYTAGYKKRWTEDMVPMTDITIYPATVQGKLLMLAQRLKNLRRKDKKDDLRTD